MSNSAIWLLESPSGLKDFVTFNPVETENERAVYREWKIWRVDAWSCEQVSGPIVDDQFHDLPGYTNQSSNEP